MHHFHLKNIKPSPDPCNENFWVCPWKYEANHFLKMFPDRGWSFNGLKHLTEKVTAVASLSLVRVVVDHTLPTPLQRSSKLKISHWYFDQCLYTPSRLYLLSKNILSKRFYCVFFHSHPFNDMFIVNGKSHCCNDTFTDVQFTSLLAKKYLRRIQIILCC